MDCDWDGVTTPSVSVYQLQISYRTTAGTWSAATTAATTATSTVRSLVVNTYRARVRAKLPGVGAWSNWTEPFEVVVPSRPSVPTGECVASTSGLDSTVTWTWSNPTQPQKPLPNHPTGGSRLRASTKPRAIHIRVRSVRRRDLWRGEIDGTRSAQSFQPIPSE